MHFKVLYFFLFSFLFSFSAHAQTGSGFQETGVISYFTDKVADRTTANGEKFDNEELVACHNTIPFNSKVKVTNLSSGKSVIVRINDRGPYAYGRIMDISKAAARKIGLISTGTAKAMIEVLPDAKPILSEEEPEDEDPVETKDTPVSSSTINDYEIGQTYSQWGTARHPKGYGIQVGGFGTAEAALNYCKVLRNKGFTGEKIFIQVVDLGSGPFFKVVVGEFERALDTATLKNKIREATQKTCFTTAHLKR